MASESRESDLSARVEGPGTARGVEAVVVNTRKRKAGSAKAGFKKRPVETDVVTRNERSFEKRRSGGKSFPKGPGVLPCGFRKATYGELLGLRFIESFGSDACGVFGEHVEGASVDANDRDLNDVMA